MPDESAPKPGHFLPGGAGDARAEAGGKTEPVGFTGIDPASCNTFAATADKVG